VGFKTFTSAVLTSSDVNTYLMQQAVITCTSSTRPSSPVEGMHIYETDTDEMYVYSGSAWVQIGSLVAWDTYTPTISGTGWAIGNGTSLGRWTRFGRTVIGSIVVTWGSTSTFGTGDLVASLPVAAQTSSVRALGFAQDADGSNYHLVGNLSSSSLTFMVMDTSGAFATQNTVINTRPFTWVSGDLLNCTLIYEASS